MLSLVFDSSHLPGPKTNFFMNIVGVTKARAIARVHRLSLIGVHHMEAHALVARYANSVNFILLR